MRFCAALYSVLVATVADPWSIAYRPYGMRMEDWIARRQLDAVDAARADLERAREALREAVLSAAAVGATESGIARRSGLSRTTVRAWLAQSRGSGAQR